MNMVETERRAFQWRRSDMLKINYIGHGNDDMPEDEQVELLCVKLKEYALDSVFEAYGDFCSELEASVLEACGYGLRQFPEPRIYRFHGNFAELSFVFSVDTDDDALITRLIGLIQENKASAGYKEMKDLSAEREAKSRRARLQQRIENLNERVLRETHNGRFALGKELAQLRQQLREEEERR
jgi:hypothetical protein